MSKVRFLPRADAKNLEALLIEARLTAAVVCSNQMLAYRELTANQLRKIYRFELGPQRTPTAALANPPFGIPP